MRCFRWFLDLIVLLGMLAFSVGFYVLLIRLIQSLV